MAQQTLLGGDGVTGESGATHNSKANSNFTELYAATAAAQADADNAQSDISAHVSANPAHTADNISITPFGTIGAGNVQDALEEIATEAGAAVPSATETVEGVAELATQAETNTGSDDLRIVTPLKLHTKVVGVQDLWIPAAAMWPRVTSGCSALTQSELSTSLVNIQTLDFDQTTQEFCQFQIKLPRKWNLGTVTAEVDWTASSGSGGVVFGLSGGAYSNDDAMTVALGTAQTMTDTLLSTNDFHTTPTSSAITLAGTPAAADFLVFQLSRNPADGSDTLTADAKVLAITIHITTSAAKDA